MVLTGLAYFLGFALTVHWFFAGNRPLKVIDKLPIKIMALNLLLFGFTLGYMPAVFISFIHGFALLFGRILFHWGDTEEDERRRVDEWEDYKKYH